MRRVHLIIIIVIIFLCNSLQASTITDLLALYGLEATTTQELDNKLKETLSLQKELEQDASLAEMSHVSTQLYNEQHANILLSADKYIYELQEQLTATENAMARGTALSPSQLLQLDAQYESIFLELKDKQAERAQLTYQLLSVVSKEECAALRNEAIALSKNAEKIQEEIDKRKDDLPIGELLNIKAPVQGDFSISSPFGIRLDPITGSGLVFHKGIDLAAPKGAPVVAEFTGKVIDAGHNPTMGNYVWIAHGGRVRTVYMHLDSLSCKRGDMVNQYDEIGKVGSTGQSTGPHLHFGLYIDSKVYDPQKLWRK